LYQSAADGKERLMKGEDDGGDDDDDDDDEDDDDDDDNDDESDGANAVTSGMRGRCLFVK
jgi:hypothetical protein